MQQLHLFFPVSPRLFSPEAMRVWSLVLRCLMWPGWGCSALHTPNFHPGVEMVAVVPHPGSPATGAPHGLTPCAWASLPTQEQPGRADPGRLRAVQEVWG